MNRDRIQNTLQDIFQDDSRWPHKGRRIVFWYDPDGQFQPEFDEITLINVTKHPLNGTPFTTKHRLLIQEPEQNFLLYAPYPEPAPADNWLLDIQKSGKPFSADRAALIFADLQLHQRHLEVVIRQHLKFFDSAKRTKSLQEMSLPPDIQESDLLLAMLCVLAGLKAPDALSFIRQVLMSGLLESDNKLWADIDSLVSTAAFWRLVNNHLRIADDKPSLKKLLNRLLITHLETTLYSTLPATLAHYAIRPSQQAYAFIDRWMRDKLDSDALKSFTQEISIDLEVFPALELMPADILKEAAIFEAVDQILARKCIAAIQAETTDFAYWRELIKFRHTLFWAPKYQSIYQALEAAINLFELKQNHTLGFSQPAAQLFNAYTTELYQFDRAYRDYIVASDAIPDDILKGLTKDVENLYVNWFLAELGYNWSDSLGTEWKLPDMPLQSQFFQKQVAPTLKGSEREKVFVIISDAMRYEVATELKEAIAKDLRGDLTLKPQLCLLPSVTELGMAALLPGKTLELLPNRGDVKVDGLSTQGIASRIKVLEQNSGVSSTAIGATELMSKNVAEGRELVKPHRLIYIYHDVIDGRGEKPPIEREVMKACGEAITEVLKLVKRICNRLNGTHVIITADHGFLYQRKSIDTATKITLPSGDDILKTNRRYVLRTKTQHDVETLIFPLSQLANSPLNIVVPRGSVRFAKQGAGAQYVHGGASLQEVCVPIVTYHHRRARGDDDGPARKVGVQINVRARRVTNNRFRLSLIQTDPVKGRWRARPITIALYHAETGEALTDVKRIELNSTGENPSDREFAQTLTVLVTNPPSRADLIVKDADDDSELLKESWTVSIGIINDFGDF